MAKLLFSLLACCTVLVSYAQNLVGNTGFEERNTCIEYDVQCAPEAWFFLPRYFRMSPVEQDSNHYEIISMGQPRKDYSAGNFIYTKLFCMLQPRTKYRVTFRIYIPTFDFDYLDFWLSPGEPGSRRNSIYSGRPTFTVPEDSIRGNRKRWRDVSYTFTAKGGERFLLIGNLQQQPLVNAKRSSRKKRTVEYWIDDIALQPLQPGGPVCPEYEAIKDQVYRNNARHPGRFIESVPIDSSLFPGRKDSVRVNPPVVVKPTEPKTPPKSDTLIIPDVLFHFNSSKLNPAFAARLDSLGRKIKNIRFSRLVIAGHTDDRGTEEYNITLSSDRAVTIRNYLADKFQLDRNLLETIGYGETQPRESNATAAGRQQNRRVELIIFY